MTPSSVKITISSMKSLAFLPAVSLLLSPLLATVANATTPFSDLFCGGRALGNCPELQGKSISELIDTIGTGPIDSPNTVMIPDGRSLQKKHADYQNPRLVIAPAASSQYSGDLYIGYSKKSNELEVISRNPETGENEFFLVSNFPENPVLKPQKESCLECHPGGQPIFAAGPWSETNANPRVAARLCDAQGGSNTYEGIEFTKDCEELKRELKENPNANSTPSTAEAFATAFGIGAGVRIGEQNQHNKNVCSQICNNPNDSNAANACKLSILNFALLGGSVNPNLPTTPTSPASALEDFYQTELQTFFPVLKSDSTYDPSLASILNDSLSKMKPSNEPGSLLSTQNSQLLTQGRFSSTIADREPPPLEEEAEAHPHLLNASKEVRLFVDKNGNEDPTYDDAFSDAFADLGLNVRNEDQRQTRRPLAHRQALMEHIQKKSSDSSSDRYDHQKPQSDAVLDRLTGQVPESLVPQYLALSSRNCLGLSFDFQFQVDQCLRSHGAKLFADDALKDLQQIATRDWKQGTPLMSNVSEALQQFVGTHCPSAPIQPSGASKAHSSK